MSNQVKGIIYSLVLGLALGVVGVYLMGYVAAIHVPVEWVLWFENQDLASRVITFVSQLLAFGIIAIIAGLILGRASDKWVLNSMLCYLAAMAYITIGTALIYKVEISNPYAGLGYLDIPTITLLPICLLISAWLSTRQPKKNQ